MFLYFGNVLLSPAVSLIGLDDGNVNRVSRFANYLRNILPHSDVTVMEMGAKAIGRYAQAESSLTAEYVEFEVHRAIEWLSQDRVELKRHAAVSGRVSLLAEWYSEQQCRVCVCCFTRC